MSEQSSRRLGRLSVTMEILTAICSGRAFRIIVSHGAVPLEDVQLVRWYTDQERNVLAFVVSHPALPEAEPNSILPELIGRGVEVSSAQ